MKNKKKLFRTLAIVLGIVVILWGISYAYVSKYYHASDVANAVLTEEHEGVSINGDEGKRVTFMPEDPKAGIIFYPGGKVEYTAYAPLLERLAENGIACVLVHMPCNLAVLDINAANGIKEQYPEIKDWYLCGHSLGGSMAATYISKHADEYAGLIMLAAYSTKNISDSKLDVLLVYGSEDGVLGMEKYEAKKDNLPDDYKEFIIDGGCHAFFGDYGDQKGDGTPFISRAEQQESTVDAITNFMLK